jgi:hypothetical protein
MNWRITAYSTAGLVALIGCIGIARGVLRARTWFRNRGIIAPLSAALSSVPGVQDEEMEKSITLNPNYLSIKRGEIGRIIFPDRFHANEGEKREVEHLVTARFPVPVDVAWHTKKRPQYASIMAAPPLPKMVKFSSQLDAIEACKPGEYIVGIDRFGKPAKLTHRGDAPMKAFSMGSGTGKSTMLGSIAAQLLGNDPTSQVTCFDTKRVSLTFLHNVPGVTLFTDPFRMDDMWNGWYALRREMNRRYTELEKDPTAEFPAHYIFLEEGNEFNEQIKNHYKTEIMQKGDGNQPPIWYQAVAPILWQGRQVNMFVIAVLQNFLDRNMGGMSLRSSFGTIGMAGYKPNQWKAIIGTTPIPESQSGQGRICIVDAGHETWVQGLYETPQYLREYAMQNRTPAITKTEVENVVP